MRTNLYLVLGLLLLSSCIKKGNKVDIKKTNEESTSLKIPEENTFNSLERALENPKMTIKLSIYATGKTLSPDVSKLYNLKYLFINSPALEELPPEIGNLKNLRHLRLEQTSVKILPKEVGNLTTLKSLVVMTSDLEEVPSEIGNLKNLKALNFAYTRIRKLPKSIKKLTNLKYLKLWSVPMSESEKDKIRKMFPHTKIEL